MGNCGTSAMTPFVLTPSGSCQVERRKGTNGVSTKGVTSMFMCFDRGTCLVRPFTYVYLHKSARAYLFPPSLTKIMTFAATPFSVDPICPQPNAAVGFHNFNLRIFNLGSQIRTNLMWVCLFDTMSDFNVPGSRPEKTR